MPRPDDTTLDLLQRARMGDGDALERLFARYLPLLRRWASGRLPRYARDMADTHDLVQETLLRTFRKIDTFEYRGEGALQAYLRQVLLNRIREEVRTAGRRPVAAEVSDAHTDPAPSPLEAAIGSAALERYERALQALKPEEREAIVARVELGLTYEELAAALGKPSAEAARKTASRAMKRLIEQMPDE